MSNYQEVIDLAQSLTGNKNLYYLQPFIKITSDSMCGLFLERIVYWSDKSGSDKLRQLKIFYKSAEEWEDEIGFSYAQSKLARDKLEAMGFIQTSRRKISPGGPPVIHYYANMEAIKEAVNQYYGSYAKLDNPEIQETRNSENDNPQIQESASSIEIQETPISSYNSSNSSNNHNKKEEENPTPTCDPRWAKIWQLWTANVHLSESPLVIEEMQQEKYLACPFEWWQQTITIGGRNRVFTWNYAKSILDRSIEAKESPDVLGPPKTKYDDKPTQPPRRGKRFDNPKPADSPLPPTPDCDLPPQKPLPPWAELWVHAASLLRGQMTQATFEQIISHLQPQPNHNGTFVLAAPPNTCEQVKRLDKKILLALQQFKPEIKELEVITQ